MKRLVALWRRLVYCPAGHAFMFARTPHGLTLVCSRCLTTHLVLHGRRLETR